MPTSEKLKINTLREFCLRANINEKLVAGVIENFSNQIYHKIELCNNGKKERKLVIAKKPLCDIHCRINDLLDTLSFPPELQGGIKGRSTILNASSHVGKQHFASFDIVNFFDSISSKVVYKSFIRLGCSPDVSHIITRLVTFNGKLPQGFATSPKVSAIVIFNLNHRLRLFFQKFNLGHTFWVDDLSVSGNYNIGKLKKLIYKIFKQEGFVLHGNPSKSKIFKRGERRVCTGLVVNEKINAKKDYWRSVRQELYLCEKFGVRSFMVNSGKYCGVLPSQYLNSLEGRIAFLCRLDERYSKYRHQFVEIKRKEPVGAKQKKR